MTLMLASVTGPVEAEIALAGGVDIVDLKDPARGALGAVAIETVRATVTVVAGRRPVSAVTGDLRMQPEPVVAAAESMAGAGVDYVSKVSSPAGSRSNASEPLPPLPSACAWWGCCSRTARPISRSCRNWPKRGFTRRCWTPPTSRRDGCSIIWTCPDCASSWRNVAATAWSLVWPAPLKLRTSHACWCCSPAS